LRFLDLKKNWSHCFHPSPPVAPFYQLYSKVNLFIFFVTFVTTSRFGFYYFYQVNDRLNIHLNYSFVLILVNFWLTICDGSLVKSLYFIFNRFFEIVFFWTPILIFGFLISNFVQTTDFRPKLLIFNFLFGKKLIFDPILSWFRTNWFRFLPKLGFIF